MTEPPAPNDPSSGARGPRRCARHRPRNRPTDSSLRDRYLANHTGDVKKTQTAFTGSPPLRDCLCISHDVEQQNSPLSLRSSVRKPNPASTLPAFDRLLPSIILPMSPRHPEQRFGDVAAPGRPSAKQNFRRDRKRLWRASLIQALLPRRQRIPRSPVDARAGATLENTINYRRNPQSSIAPRTSPHPAYDCVRSACA